MPRPRRFRLRRSRPGRSRPGRTLAGFLSPPDLGPGFARLWLASAISAVGDGALLTAGPLLAASITRRPAAVALAVLAQALPWPLFALVSGAIVDRLDRRRLAVAVDCCRGAALAALTVVVAAGHVQLWQIYGVLFVLGTGETLAENATTALVLTVVGAPALSRANARIYTTFTLGNQLAGPPVGALLFVLGVAWPFALDAASFLLGAAILLRMRPSPPSPASGQDGERAGPSSSQARGCGEGDVTDGGGRLRDDIAAGVRWLARTPALRRWPSAFS